MMIGSIKIKQEDFTNSENLIFKQSAENWSFETQTGVCHCALMAKLEFPNQNSSFHLSMKTLRNLSQAKTRVSREKLEFSNR